MEISVMNKQRKVRFDLAWLRRVANVALAECISHSGDGRFALRQLPMIDVAVVSDAVIARVHQEFMGVPGATDVITFDHGEIVVSAETALVCAKQHRHSVEQELALYVIHGLLHLNGFDDTTRTAKVKMFRVQDRVWRLVMNIE